MNGILVVNKEMNYTSFDVVAIVKGITKEKHLGHTGTLDPNATGVLPICFGYATRLIEYMDKAPKTYIASAKFGLTTDTQDIWGNVTDRKENFDKIDEDALLNILGNFTGDITQVPSLYSAVRVGGRHLYSYAHSGESVEIPARQVKVYSIKLLSFDHKAQEFSIEVCCGRGTYVRSICNDIGQLLGPGACLTSLKRVSACGYGTEDGISIDELRKLSQEEVLGLIRPAASAVSFMNRVEIDSQQRIDFINGKHLKVHQGDLSFEEPVCVFYEDELCGIGIWDNPNRIKPNKVFAR